MNRLTTNLKLFLVCIMAVTNTGCENQSAPISRAASTAEFAKFCAIYTEALQKQTDYDTKSLEVINRVRLETPNLVIFQDHLFSADSDQVEGFFMQASKQDTNKTMTCPALTTFHSPETIRKYSQQFTD